MKKIILFLVLTAAAFTVYAQTSLESSLKEVVCLVTVGYVNSASSGSGFLINDGEGNSYIISNDHVTEKSNVISVIFRDDNGVMKRYDNMIVLANDPLYDLSVLGFPLGRKLAMPGIKIDLTSVDIGLNVSAAGFPGRWSFAEGVIIDNNAQAFRSYTIQRFIAHNAYTAPGSSGGPLLRRQPDLPYGYAVVGVNTLGIDNGTGFSIPCERVVWLLNNAVEKKSEGRILRRDNAVMENAVRIEFENPVISTSIQTSNYTGWYVLSFPSEENVNLTLKSSEIFKLEIIDDNGMQLASSSGENPSINIKVPSGNFYIKVSGDIQYWTTYRISIEYEDSDGFK